MEKLKTQDVWKDARLWPQYPQKENQGNEITAFKAGYKAAIDKLSDPNMILISPEELRGMIATAFSAGDDFGNFDFIKRNKIEKEFAWLADDPLTKEQYINSLFK